MEQEGRFAVIAPRATYRRNGLCRQGHESRIPGKALSLVHARHITASVCIIGDECGLHNDYEKWLVGLAPHAPVSQ